MSAFSSDSITHIWRKMRPTWRTTQAAITYSRQHIFMILFPGSIRYTQLKLIKAPSCRCSLSAILLLALTKMWAHLWKWSFQEPTRCMPSRIKSFSTHISSALTKQWLMWPPIGSMMGWTQGVYSTLMQTVWKWWKEKWISILEGHKIRLSSGHPQIITQSTQA